MSVPEEKLFIKEEVKEPTILDWIMTQDVLSSQVILGLVIILISTAFMFFHLYTGFFGQPEAHLFRSVHLTFVFMLTFLFYPLGRKNWKDKLNGWFLIDLLGILLSIATQVYYLVDPDEFIVRIADPSTWDMIMGTMVILLVMETARRVIGNTMVILSAFFLLHALYADKFFGFLYSPPSSYSSVISHVVMEETGIYTTPLATIASFVVLFLILGAFLLRTGLGKFFLNMAFLLVARHTGGPGKVSVVSSAAFGTISGSAVANVMVDGAITIPVMKRMGYRPEMAGAIEALASCFGMFTPPVMGAAAFIIAAFLWIPYLKVCVHAALPCFLFYFSIFFMIDFHGRRHGLRGVPRAQLPGVKEVLAGQWFLLIPVIVLIWLLIGGYTPSFASFWAILLTFAISFVRKESRISLVDFIGVFEEGARNTLIPATACAAAGIIIGSTTLSGLALKIGAIIISFSMDQLWLSLILIIILSIILGMGLPTTGVYITLAVTVIPIIEKMGVLPIGAHLFAFYYGVLSNVIPPVAIASFAAAGIAGGKPMRTAWNGFFMALPGLIVPILFVYRPELLLIGSLGNIIYYSLISMNIVILLSAAIQGWFLGNLSWPVRFVFVIPALMMCFDSPTVLYLGLGLSFLFYAYQAYRRNALKSGIAEGGQA
jgi:TRAP transporter 4TM/12TM fusion protein